jgi:cytochrome c oxidase subunit 2
VPLWAKAVDKFPSEDESTVVQVVGEQFNWNARFKGKDGEFGRQEMRFVKSDNVFGVDPTDEKGKDDVQVLNEIHVPLVKNDKGEFKPVIMYISSRDVIHSFKLNAMRITQDAIPGMRVPIHFTPTMEGRFQILCAQLCGTGHSSMSQGFLVVESEEAFNRWIDQRSGGGNTSYE